MREYSGLIYQQGIYPVQIIENNGIEFLAANQQSGDRKKIYPLQERDLFIRFASLSGNPEDFVSFMSEWGLLGLYNRYHRSSKAWLKDHGYSWLEDEKQEPVVFVIRFHNEFKMMFSIAKDYLDGSITEENNEKLGNWLWWWFSSDVAPYPAPRLEKMGRHSLRLYPKSLAGSLVLQLYNFVVRKTKLKICALPGCNNMTTRKKFCSDKHGNLYNTWKTRGKI